MRTVFGAPHGKGQKVRDPVFFRKICPESGIFHCCFFRVEGYDFQRIKGSTAAGGGEAQRISRRRRGSKDQPPPEAARLKGSPAAGGGEAQRINRCCNVYSTVSSWPYHTLQLDNSRRFPQRLREYLALYKFAVILTHFTPIVQHRYCLITDFPIQWLPQIYGRDFDPLN